MRATKRKDDVVVWKNRSIHGSRPNNTATCDLLTGQEAEKPSEARITMNVCCNKRKKNFLRFQSILMNIFILLLEM